MGESVAAVILYYFPAAIFAAILVWMNTRIGKIAKIMSELLIQNRAMAERLSEIQKLLENRKS